MGSLLRSMFGRILGSEPTPVADGGTQAVAESDAESPPSGDDGPQTPAIDDEDGLSQYRVIDDAAAAGYDALQQPTFMLDTDGRVALWNDAMEGLTERTKEEALGHEHVSEMFYADGRRSMTLADKVLDSPESAHEEYDIELVDAEANRYRDTSISINEEGTERHVEFYAAPYYVDGELVAIVETIINKTDIAERSAAVNAVVTEVSSTMAAVRNGNFDRRAELDDSHRENLDEETVAVLGNLNEFIESFEELSAQVDRQAERLEDTISRTVGTTDDIATHIDEQTDMLEDAVSEMQSFSARMEEVAATAKDVDDAAVEAREVAEDGLEASRSAQDATDEVTEIGDELVDDITALDDRMDDIEDIVEVISDVAEQTNLLALNANIEAARAGSDGDGFTVVAEEVKTLADETREHTEDITGRIEDLRQQTDKTVGAAVESRDQIDETNEQITDVLSAFDQIADSVEEAADGIAEVSRANDEQASAVEEVTASLENVRDLSEQADNDIESVIDVTEEQTEAIEALLTRVEELRGTADE